jgi:predicted nucleic acid-binding protein
MSVYVLDSNIVSFYLKEHKQVISRLEEAILAGDEVLIAPIAYYEVRRGLLRVGAENRMKKFVKLCQMFAVGQLDNSILDVAADIYVKQCAQGRPMEDADILIAAFCKRHGFALVTNNTKHFDPIPDLPLLDWTAAGE